MKTSSEAARMRQLGDMRITYDAEARTAYVYLSDNQPLNTREITGVVLIDQDADANVVGIEILGVLRMPTVEDITGCRCDRAATPAPEEAGNAD